MQQQIEAQVEILDKDRREINDINRELETAGGKYSNTKSLHTSNYYEYIFWCILAILIVWTVVYQMGARTSPNMAIVTVVVLGLAIYFTMYSVYRKYKYKLVNFFNSLNYFKEYLFIIVIIIIVVFVILSGGGGGGGYGGSGTSMFDSNDSDW